MCLSWCPRMPSQSVAVYVVWRVYVLVCTQADAGSHWNHTMKCNAVSKVSYNASSPKINGFIKNTVPYVMKGSDIQWNDQISDFFHSITVLIQWKVPYNKTFHERLQLLQAINPFKEWRFHIKKMLNTIKQYNHRGHLL